MSAVEFANGSGGHGVDRLFHGHYPPECAEWCRAILTYRDRYVRTAVWELKYRKSAKIASIFGELLVQELAKYAGDSLVIPIPLSEKRRRERGYNQIELILEQLPAGNRWNIELDLLHRKHHTVPQTKLSRAERLKNLDDCFEVTDPQRVVGKNVVIVDDVMTTGSTLRRAREVLLKAGAKEVLGLALAH